MAEKKQQNPFKKQKSLRRTMREKDEGNFLGGFERFLRTRGTVKSVSRNLLPTGTHTPAAAAAAVTRDGQEVGFSLRTEAVEGVTEEAVAAAAAESGGEFPRQHFCPSAPTVFPPLFHSFGDSNAHSTKGGFANQ